MKKSTDAEMKKLFVDVAMTEYSELRSEIRETISKQFTVISATFTILVSLFTFCITLMSNNNKAAELSEFISAVFYVIIPCFCMFSGIVWLDYVYRQVKMGTYIFFLENKINRMFVNESEIDDMHKCPMFWERYAEKDANKRFLFKINHWNYYFSMALYIGLPIVSIFYLMFVKDGEWYIWCNITLIIFVCFIVFLTGYCKAINRQIVKINGVSLYSENEEFKRKHQENNN